MGTGMRIHWARREEQGSFSLRPHGRVYAGATNEYAFRARLTSSIVDSANDHAAPQHLLYFFPLPHGHGSLRPIFGSGRIYVSG
jgi:hypothetical protein